MEQFHLGLKALIRNSVGEILLLEKNPARVSLPHWDLPGGRMNTDENLEEALRREVEEEIGINDIKILEQFDISISNKKSDQEHKLLLLTYLCAIENPDDVRLMDDEHISYKWCSPEEASKLLVVKFGPALAEKVKNLK